MGFHADVLLIGAQKAGTTSLAGLLEQHPDICVSQPKEVHYYSRHFERGEDWYKKCFPDAHCRVKLDASTSYAKAPIRGTNPDPVFSGIPERVFQANPQMRLLYILRDPVQRAWSGWQHLCQTGRETRPFETVLKDADAALIDIGDYLGQIKLWTAHFPASQFHFVDFQDLLNDPGTVAGGAFDFLGLPAMAKQTIPEHRNEARQMSALGQSLTRRVLETPGLMQIRRRMPSGLRGMVRRMLSTGAAPKKDIPPIARNYIVDSLSPTWPELEKLTGISTQNWAAAKEPVSA